MIPKKLVRSRASDKISKEELEVIKDDKVLNNLYAKKIQEELIEIQSSDHKDILEFVDLIQVAMDFAKVNGFNGPDVRAALLKKEAEKGNFGRLALNNLNPENPSNKIYFQK